MVDNRSMSTSQSQTWSEKYRPQTLSQVISADDAVAAFHQMIEKDDWPQMVVLYGEPGTGKTSLVNAALNDYMDKRGVARGDQRQHMLELDRRKDFVNADTLAEHMKPGGKVDLFIRSMSLFGPKVHRFIVIDEAQQLTNLMQQYLLKPIEDFAKRGGTFILMGMPEGLFRQATGPDDIPFIPALKSRAQGNMFVLQRPSPEEVMPLLKNILDLEQCTIDPAELQRISAIPSEGSSGIRGAIGELQAKCRTSTGERPRFAGFAKPATAPATAGTAEVLNPKHRKQVDIDSERREKRLDNWRSLLEPGEIEKIGEDAAYRRVYKRVTGREYDADAIGMDNPNFERFETFTLAGTTYYVAPIAVTMSEFVEITRPLRDIINDHFYPLFHEDRKFYEAKVPAIRKFWDTGRGQTFIGTYEKAVAEVKAKRHVPISAADLAKLVIEQVEGGKQGGGLEAKAQAPEGFAFEYPFGSGEIKKEEATTPVLIPTPPKQIEIDHDLVRKLLPTQPMLPAPKATIAEVFKKEAAIRDPLKAFTVKTSESEKRPEKQISKPETISRPMKVYGTLKLSESEQNLLAADFRNAVKARLRRDPTSPEVQQFDELIQTLEGSRITFGQAKYSVGKLAAALSAGGATFAKSQMFGPGGITGKIGIKDFGRQELADLMDKIARKAVNQPLEQWEEELLRSWEENKMLHKETINESALRYPKPRFHLKVKTGPPGWAPGMALGDFIDTGTAMERKAHFEKRGFEIDYVIDPDRGEYESYGSDDEE